MTYDRDYMRQESSPNPFRIGMLGWIMISLLGVYVIQNLVLLLGGNEFYFRTIYQPFTLSRDALSSGKVWTLLSYGLLHDTGGLFHILANLIGIFFFGRNIVALHGNRTLLHAMIIATLVGGLAYAGLHRNPHTSVMGASSACFGLIALFCMTRPNEPITLFLYFIIPISLKPKWLLAILTGISIFGILMWELAGASSTAHSAHLGGLIAGVIYHLVLTGKLPLSFPRKGPRVVKHKPDVFPKIPRRKRPVEVDYTVNLSSRDKLRSEIDRILDKINAQGFGSLSPEERNTLEKGREILNKHP